MKITIDNRDLAYTIDTYGMFTGESAEDMERENLVEDHPSLESKQFELYFNYDHPAIVKALAEKSVEILDDEFTDRFEYGDELNGTRPKIYDGIVDGIALISESSPQFYNYTTDSYKAEWTVNDKKLDEYIAARQGEYNNFERDNWYTVYDSHGTDRFNREDYIVAMLDFYTRDVFSEDSYNEQMWEFESEAYYENMTPDEDTQKLINESEK